MAVTSFGIALMLMAGAASAKDKTASAKFAIVIERKEITGCVQSGGACLKDSRSVPYFVDGKVVGYKLVSVGRGGFLERLKLRKGDVIISANGEALAGSGRLAYWMIQIVTVKAVELEVLRGGRSVRIDYQVKD